MNTRPSLYKKIGIALFWLLLWQLLSMAVHNNILLVGPAETALRLIRLLQMPRFYLALATSWLRILGGLFLGSAEAVALARLSGRFAPVRSLLEPFVSVLRSIPVASFVILILIWAGGQAISIYISAIIVFPILYQGTLTGLSAVDPKMRQMARVFRFPFRSRLQCIELPASLPSLRSALTLAIGMAFKSGVAAEVIAQAGATLGNELYRAKINLETGDLLAYTAVIIFCAWASDRLLLALLHRLTDRFVYRHRPAPAAAAHPALSGSQHNSAGLHAASAQPTSVPDIALNSADPQPLIALSHVTKHFSEHVVLEDINLQVNLGDLLLITGISGSGKSTLLQLMLGLLAPDAGELQWHSALCEQQRLSRRFDRNGIYAGTVFQEDRLCEGFSGADQLWMQDPRRNQARYGKLAAELDAVLGIPSSGQPVETYSGGMRRRCAILRALCCDSPLLIMDEPFSGLDEAARAAMLEYILAHRGGRALVLTVHDGNEVPGLEAFETVQLMKTAL